MLIRGVSGLSRNRIIDQSNGYRINCAGLVGNSLLEPLASLSCSYSELTVGFSFELLFLVIASFSLFGVEDRFLLGLWGSRFTAFRSHWYDNPRIIGAGLQFLDNTASMNTGGWLAPPIF